MRQLTANELGYLRVAIKQALEAQEKQHRKDFGSVIVSCDTAEERYHFDVRRAALAKLVKEFEALIESKTGFKY